MQPSNKRLASTTVLLLAWVADCSLAQTSAPDPTNTETSAQEAPQLGTMESTGSTVVYSAEFFAPYNPVTVNDMLDRIPGLSIDNGGGPNDGGDRGLGTEGNLLINGQRLAGKDNSLRDQLNRITAREVQRIEIIRDTSGQLNVRGASEVVNVILVPTESRATTTVELVSRHNHDDTFEAGGSVVWSYQAGGFQALINLEDRPNYENRDDREKQLDPDGELLGTLFETNIRDQDELNLSTNLSYSTGAHRMQLNTLIEDGDHPRPIHREFIDFTDTFPVMAIEEELIGNEEQNWEIGGDYEYSFGNGSRLSVLFVINDEIRNSVRERFAADPADLPLSKNLFIESNQNTSERIVQGNYSFSLNDTQSLRLGLERADTRLDSSLFIGSNSGNLPPSDRYGGLSPQPAVSNPGTEVQELRNEAFAFHNWALNERMSLESSLVYEASEISQSGEVSKTRDFRFWRPAVDYRFNFANNFRLRASVRRDISQLSFSSFAATANEDDRDRDVSAGNPELVPEKSWNYEAEVEYRLPDDAGVLSTRIFYTDIEDYIGRINATVDPNRPLSATGNAGDAQRWGMSISASSRLGYFNLPDAILSANLGLFDSEFTDPFLGTKQRIGGRGFGNLSFRHDVTSLGLSYGLELRQPIDGGDADVDITTITRDRGQPSLDLFASKVWFNDWTFRLESDNTLDESRCRERLRFNGTTIDGSLRVIEDSCSSRYRRLTLTVQTTF